VLNNLLLFPYIQSQKPACSQQHIMQIHIIFTAFFKSLSNCEYIGNSRSYWTKFHSTFIQFFLTKSDNLLFSNIANTVDAILSSVICLQLLHFNLSPFLYIRHTIHLFLCVGSCFYRIFFQINVYSFCLKVLPPFFFINSGGYVICISSFTLHPTIHSLETFLVTELFLLQTLLLPLLYFPVLH